MFARLAVPLGAGGGLSAISDLAEPFSRLIGLSTERVVTAKG